MSDLTHVNKELLQIVEQLVEVGAGDHLVLGLGEAVLSQLEDLVVKEAQHRIALLLLVQCLIGRHKVAQPLFHLCCGLPQHKTRIGSLLGHR